MSSPDRWNGTDLAGLPWHAATEGALRLHLELRAGSIRIRRREVPESDPEPLIWFGPAQGRAVESSPCP